MAAEKKTGESASAAAKRAATIRPAALDLSTSVAFVKGIGPRLAGQLATRGIHTVEDILYHLPFRYEDRLNPQPLSALTPGAMASIIGEVRGSILLRTRNMPIFELTVGQGLQTIKCSWFHGTYLKDKFHAGQMVALYGKVEPSRSRTGAMKMIQPQFEILPADGDAEDMLEVGRIVPVYESLGGTTAWGAKLTSRWLRRVLWGLLEELKSAEIPETLPAPMLSELGLPSRLDALRAVHFPPAGTSIGDLQASNTPAHRRLIFEELFYLELGLELKRRRMREREGIAFATGESVRNAIKQILPFHPTAAQKRVLGEIAAEMRRPHPMRRLLQGDVGSGKTIVALQAALIAIENGYQAALMAPTEILATQHYLAARKLLERSSKRYNISLLTGSLDDDVKRATRGKIMRGETNLIIGTHALFQEKTEFSNLGLVIVDEQHRFGVQQRFALMKKPGGVDPDTLVMTATPIPRTLALTLYGDLDLSIIDEMPPGRTPIITRRTSDEMADEVWGFVRKQVEAGHQAYIVYPVIEGAKDDQPELDFPVDEPPVEESPKKKSKQKKIPLPKPNLKSAMTMYDELRAGALSGLRLGILHGRLSPEDKEVAMRRFQRGEIDVLIATTVIEVGVDVPNASVMVIEHAERFGLAQMHQLRGRVGRGAAKSYCVLMTGGKISQQAEERLDAMVRTQNGFELAELDLAQRGPGEFFGTRQTGLPEFRVANLLRDRKMLELAKQQAANFIETMEPQLTAPERVMVRSLLKQHWQRKYGLIEA
ncbi:MAG TPA: ATP-dependent DNA helicase RecG [Acidobacteriaceae bacterium]|jgi:ATP-dependent DNA helicase RecG|nr:ATP-dependent DNA helicase RecG [Acidobacteriaceae bacterium]